VRPPTRRTADSVSLTTMPIQDPVPGALTDCEKDKVLRAVLAGMLREAECWPGGPGARAARRAGPLGCRVVLPELPGQPLSRLDNFRPSAFRTNVVLAYPASWRDVVPRVPSTGSASCSSHEGRWELEQRAEVRVDRALRKAPQPSAEVRQRTQSFLGGSRRPRPPVARSLHVGRPASSIVWQSVAAEDGQPRTLRSW